MKQNETMNTRGDWKPFSMSREDALEEVVRDPKLRIPFWKLNQECRERFLEFLQGTKTLPVTYDPFFKAVFHPDVHPERLSSFISSLLGIQVKVKAILPSEDRLSDGDSLLIMDVLVELEDGSLTNVEIQKVPYAFPEGRMSCYSSDLVMRQYARARGERGKHFTYRDMKKVYTIIIFEKSTQVFHQIPQSYIHRGSTKFDTGLELSLLQEYCLVCLDVFREFPYAKDKNEQTAWLSFLLTETVEEAEKLVNEYPWLEEIYRELAMLRRKPEEVLGMFSDALKIMDQNTVKYMIDEQQQIMDEQRQILDEQQQKMDEQRQILDEQQQKMNEQQQEYFRQKLLNWKKSLISQSQDTLDEMVTQGGLNQPDQNDRASLEADKALELRTRDRARKLISKINEALQRIEDGVYGYCEDTGEPIGIERLEARPIATLSIEAQERHERMEKTYDDEA